MDLRKMDLDQDCVFPSSDSELLPNYLLLLFIIIIIIIINYFISYLVTMELAQDCVVWYL
jgi:hypothetical protein